MRLAKKYAASQLSRECDPLLGEYRPWVYSFVLVWYQLVEKIRCWVGKKKCPASGPPETFRTTERKKGKVFLFAMHGRLFL